MLDKKSKKPKKVDVEGGEQKDSSPTKSPSKKKPKETAGTVFVKEIKATEVGKKNSRQNPQSKKSTARVADASTASQKRAETLLDKKKRRAKRTLKDRILISLGFGAGDVTLRDPKSIEAANALRLRPHHLRRLKAKFDTIDIDGSGNIDSDEFFEAIGEQRTPFTDKLFKLIDLDGSGTIEFDEFVRVLATYCMFTKEEVLRFCFECFDKDGSGAIDEKEFIELCKTVNNASPTFPANFKAALESFDVNEDGLIDYEEFLELDRRFPLVLFPAFRLQDFMQRNTLGEKQWKRIMEDYNNQRVIEKYKHEHGGRAPPDPPLMKIGKMILPCIFYEHEFVPMGAEMEHKHRA